MLACKIGTNDPISHAISQTTNLLLTTVTTASNYYVSRASPSPSHPSNLTPTITPPPLPPRALVFLTSERTRKGLAGVHAVSGQAVQVSAKTVSIIDNMIRRAMGAQPKRARAFLPNTSLPPSPSPSPRVPSPASQLAPHASSPPSTSCLVPPPRYYPAASPSPSFPNNKPALPPRRSPSPTPRHPPAVIDAQYPSYNSVAGPMFLYDKPPLPPRRSPSPATASPLPRTAGGTPPSVTPLPQHRLTTKDSVLLSADLILSTLDHSARQLLNEGTESVGTVVGHKYVVLSPPSAHPDKLL